MSIIAKRGVCFSCGHDHGDGFGSPGLLRVLKARGDEVAAYQAEIADLRTALEAAQQQLAQRAGSGCACKFDSDDKISSPCLMHREWANRQQPDSGRDAALEKLQRYEESCGEGGGVYPCANGPYVKLADVQALASQPSEQAAGGLPDIWEGYEGGTCTSDIHGLGGTIKLHYQSPAEAENAFDMLCNFFAATSAKGERDA